MRDTTESKAMTLVTRSPNSEVRNLRKVSDMLVARRRWRLYEQRIENASPGASATAVPGPLGTDASRASTARS